tara:strand:+ start:1617 stop:1817 length:201 start_codon:yes stop_codon:yes gene_type:complete
MPVWLRKFTYQQITDHKKREKDEYEKASSGDKTTAKLGDKKIPEAMRQAMNDTKRTPSYSTKANKK